MKGQKGSALLTVVLIIFIAIVIGTALAMMVVSNYRLRVKDVAIQRAEYDTVEIMDYVVFATKQEIINKLYGDDGWKDDIYEDIYDEAEEQQDAYDSLMNSSQTETYKYNEKIRKVDKGEWNYITYEGDISASIINTTHKHFDQYLTLKFLINETRDINVNENGMVESLSKAEENSWIDNWTKGLGGIIENKRGIKRAFNINDFGSSEKKFMLNINRGDISIESNTISVPLQIFYQNTEEPIVEVKTNLTILVPTYKQVESEELYDKLEDIVGYTKMEYKNWGFI